MEQIWRFSLLTVWVPEYCTIRSEHLDNIQATKFFRKSLLVKPQSVQIGFVAEMDSCL